MKFKNILISSTLSFLLLGCGGGGGDSSSSTTSNQTSSITPTVTLSSEDVVMYAGSTVRLSIRASNVSNDLTTVLEDKTNRVIDYVSYTVTGQNTKTMDILIYGANPGVNKLILNADNKVRKSITVTVNPSTDPNIDIGNGSININNQNNEIKTVTDIEVLPDGGTLESTLTITAPNTAYITGTTIDFGSSKTLSVNFNIPNYDNSNIKSFVKIIDFLKMRDENTTYFKLSNDISQSQENGMNFTISNLNYSNLYSVVISTDLGIMNLNFNSKIRYADSDGDGLDDKTDLCPTLSGSTLYDGCEKPDKDKESNIAETKNDDATCQNDDNRTVTKLLLSSSSCSDSFITDSRISFDGIKNSLYDPLINLNFIRYNSDGQRFYADKLSVLSVSQQLNSTKVIPSDKITQNGMSFALTGIEFEKIYDIKISVGDTGTNTMCSATLNLLTSNTCLDSDNDGVSDNLDYCSGTIVSDKKFVDEKGCYLDSDGDGILDKDDKCINVVGISEFFGCPDPDKDNDGVDDANDSCKDTPIGEIVDSKGCSDSQKDTDGDGVTDDKDECKDTPAGSKVDTKGCPLPTPTPTPSATPTPSVTPKPSSLPTNTPTTTVKPTNTTVVTITPTPAPSGALVPVDESDLEVACTTTNGYVVLENSTNDIYAENDGWVYFRALTSHSIYLYYKPASSSSRDTRVFDLNLYTIPSTLSQFQLKIADSLADGSRFYVKENDRCFRGVFPKADTITSKGIFPDKTLVFIK